MSDMIFHRPEYSKHIPNIFHHDTYFITSTEHVIFHSCLIIFSDDIQTVLWLHKLIKVTAQSR